MCGSPSLRGPPSACGPPNMCGPPSVCGPQVGPQVGPHVANMDSRLGACVNAENMQHLKRNHGQPFGRMCNTQR